MDKIYLWENEPPYFDESIGQERPSVPPYLVDDGQVHGAMIVAPGGAYMMKAEHEGAPIAQRLNASQMLDRRVTADEVADDLRALHKLGLVGLQIDQLDNSAVWQVTEAGSRKWVLEGRMTIV